MLQRSLQIILCLVAICYTTTDAVAVMSIDLGSEWMKVAIVSPGVPMEIALNKESQRKTPVVVALRDGERFFGDLAQSIGVRFPDKMYGYLLDLLGKKLDNPTVVLYKERFPFYKITADPIRETVVFHHPEGHTFSPEELLAMVFKCAQEIATSAADQPVNDAVITVPPFFNQAERRALLHAAKLSGIKVLQIMNTNTAVALHYGIFRRKDFNDTPVNILFYDMGASSTTATIATYQMIKSKERGFTETNPQVTIRGVGFDRILGGLEMQLRLRDYLGKAFNDQKKTKADVFKSPRALAKLLSESGRLKKVLSANNEHKAQVENVLDDQDLKVPYSREEFEELVKDLLERVPLPVETALKMAAMTMDDISQIILAGAGTRVPSVQLKLQEATGITELGKSINTDEAAALGAVYQAAYLSKGFKVKTFLIKEANLFPIQVDFQRDYETDDGQKGTKIVRRTLFGRGNPIPQKKVITFTRHTKDFEFSVNYGDIDFLSPTELQSFGCLNITNIKLTGVEEAISKHSEDDSEAKGVKAKFHMDESGLLSLDSVESVFDKRVEAKISNEESDIPIDLESTLAKLGSTIGKLFSSAGSLDEGNSETDPTPQTPEEDIPLEKGGPGDDAKETEGEDKKDDAGVDSSQTDQVNKSEKVVNESVDSSASATQPEKTTKIVSFKELLTTEIQKSDLVDPTLEQNQLSVEKLKTLDEQDKARLARDKARNALESFILETKDKLLAKEFVKASTEENRETFLKQLSEVGEWLEYESDDAKTEVFRDKLADLKSLTRDVFDRVREHKERPEALKALRDMLNISTVFLAGAKNVSEDDQIFTEVEMTTLNTLIEDTKKWLMDMEGQQKETVLFETPKLTVKSIAEKIAGLDREVKYMLNKARFATPKKKTPPKSPEIKIKLNESDSLPGETETKDETKDENENLQLEGEIETVTTESEETVSVEDDAEPTPTAPETPPDQSHSEL